MQKFVMVEPIRNWSSSRPAVRIAALLVAETGGEPLDPDLIAHRMGRGSSRATKDVLRRLHRGGLVTRAKRPTGRRGRPAWGYSLTHQQRLTAQGVANPADGSSAPGSAMGAGENKTADPPSEPAPIDAATLPATATTGDGHPGRLRRGQELVIVDVAGTQLADVVDVLSDTTVADRAHWVALFGDELAFAFDGPDPAEPATDLLAVFAGARLDGHRATVARVLPAEDFISQARRTAPIARRARMTRDARDMPQ